MSKRFCTNCGAEVAWGESHCMECGKKLPDLPPETAELPSYEEPDVAQSQPPPIYPFGQPQQPPIDQKQEKFDPQQRQQEPRQNFGHFHPYPPPQYPPPPQRLQSQPFVIYLFGLLTQNSNSLKMEFQSNSAKNSTLLLIFLCLVNYILYNALFDIFPFTVTEGFLSTLLPQGFPQNSVNFTNQSFQELFSLSGLFRFIFLNIMLGTLALALILNSNRLDSPFKKAFMISIASLLPIIIIEVMRYLIEATIISGLINRPLVTIDSQAALTEYLGLIYNTSLTYQPVEVRIGLIIMRIVWTVVLIQKLFLAVGLSKQTANTYTFIFVALVGGGYDLINQIFFLLL